MKYLNLTDKNKNFFIKDELLFHVHSDFPIADLSNGKYLQNKADKMREKVEFFPSGARVTIDCGGERCIQFYGNDGNKLAETFWHRGQNKDDISILPIDIGVFSSGFEGKRLIYKFVDYENNFLFTNHNFSKVYQNVETCVERRGQRREVLSRTEKFKRAVANRTEVAEKQRA